MARTVFEADSEIGMVFVPSDSEASAPSVMSTLRPLAPVTSKAAALTLAAPAQVKEPQLRVPAALAATETVSAAAESGTIVPKLRPAVLTI